MGGDTLRTRSSGARPRRRSRCATPRSSWSAMPRCSAGSCPQMRHDGARVRVHHASQVVEMDEKPAEALAAKPDASIAVAADLVARGEGDALVSAGNTGACVLACARRWKLLPGVRRAALAAVYPDRAAPRREGRSVLADPRRRRDDRRHRRRPGRVRGDGLGLRQAHLAEPRARASRCCPTAPRPARARRAVVDAHALLLEATELNFIGNIEGLDIPRGVADVVVSSGFVGNVVLKMLEGVSETVVRLARYAHKERLAWRLGARRAVGGDRAAQGRSPTGSSTAARRCSASSICSSRRTAGRTRAR